MFKSEHFKKKLYFMKDFWIELKAVFFLKLTMRKKICGNSIEMLVYEDVTSLASHHVVDQTGTFCHYSILHSNRSYIVTANYFFGKYCLYLPMPVMYSLLHMLICIYISESYLAFVNKASQLNSNQHFWLEGNCWEYIHVAKF